jgi:peptide/nickel transport system permease protein
MGAYILRRLLIMIPTFLGISVVVFLVLNLAPGRPGAQQRADLAADANAEATQESYRIFREQFHLDKPTLFNTRFSLTEAEVSTELAKLVPNSGATSAERVNAQDALEDYGSYAVPHLVAIMARAHAEGQSELRDMALGMLKLAARRPLVDPFAANPSQALRELNRSIDLENAEIRNLGYGKSATENEKAEIVAKWSAWFEQRRTRFELTPTRKVATFFFETRFANYWKNLLRLDFGVSLVSREPVLATLLSKLKYSLSLSVGSLILAYSISIPLGIFSAVKKNTTPDRVLTVALFMMYSLPSFFVATLLLFFFSAGSDFTALRWFPTGGWQSTGSNELTWLEQLGDIAWHLVLPLFCLTYGSLAALSRYMRTGLLEVIRSDYVRTARAKGLPETLVIGKHALRNGLMPILTLLSGLLPAILGGSVIIEYIFGIPGMGLWMVNSIYQRDYNVIMAVQLLSTVLVLVGVLLTDLSYALVDPRIRYS